MMRRLDYFFAGKIQLAVILCLASGNENPLDGIPNDVLELIDSFQLSAFTTKVGYPFAL